jgi:hypothetical protein
MAFEEVSEIQDALKDRLATLRTKSQQSAAQYLAYYPWHIKVTQ